MHLNSRNVPKQKPIKGADVYIQTFVDNVDGSRTLQEYVAPESVGTIDDFSVRALQSAGIGLTEVNDVYLHQNYATMDSLLAQGASQLVSESEIKEINNLD